MLNPTRLFALKCTHYICPRDAGSQCASGKGVARRKTGCPIADPAQTLGAAPAPSASWSFPCPRKVEQAIAAKTQRRKEKVHSVQRGESKKGLELRSRDSVFRDPPMPRMRLNVLTSGTHASHGPLLVSVES